jgi:hypothetical protein
LKRFDGLILSLELDLKFLILTFIKEIWIETLARVDDVIARPCQSDPLLRPIYTLTPPLSPFNHGRTHRTLGISCCKRSQTDSI